ncbi:tRNA 2-selenouridine(34) synthase MnmH [Leptothrix ochracea]|uniref:tRNA 2-selenouridine(34) synthase MnmH n=1 Tax=Leptothrix ochracea TaxID=735331 RepID=UPI0034E2E355
MPVSVISENLPAGRPTGLIVPPVPPVPRQHGQHSGPVGITEIAHFDTILDARSPAEFAEDHIPGAINTPALDDEERRIVGTLYKQQGAFEARRVGGAMVAANLARHLRELWAHQPHSWRPLVYCWRGGLRSGSMVQWLRLVGWDAQQLAGGYKRYRQHVIEQIDTLAPTLQLRVLCGPTGSAKTRLLHALAASGAQTIDLEALAAHRGSVLGSLPGVDQPSQKQFETRLASVLSGLDVRQPVWIEAESRKIGRIALPNAIINHLRTSPCVRIDAPLDARLDLLLRDYASLGDDPQALADKLATLHGLQANDTLERWRAWALDRDLAPLFQELMTLHYDPLYARSQPGYLKGWAQAQTITVERLDEAGLKAAAGALHPPAL